MQNIEYNIILDTDSYKASHFLQYPPDTRGLFAYIESRGGLYPQTVFFGLQYILKRYLSQPVTMSMIDEAEVLLTAHGEPFNRAGWEHIVNCHGGMLPVEIRAVPEGMVIPTGNALVTVESTDSEVFWIASYIEDILLRVWYPLTVATQSWAIKQRILHALERTSDDPQGQIPFKLHDFGARGVSSLESAGIGGMAHLVNFMGTDTVESLRYAKAYYNAPMAGYSIPASEHSTITSWGGEGEMAAYRNMIRKFGRPDALFACVADSYDLMRAVEEMFGGGLKEEIIRSGAMIVIRQDSGDPATMAIKTVLALDAAFGSVTNTKGFKVLQYTRVIYGDGINESSIRQILMDLSEWGFSADNIAFGMGGALLQQVNRDTQRMAMKTSSVLRGDVWLDVFKDPITDPGKRSKKGRLSTYRCAADGVVRTLLVEDAADHEDLMRTVWRNGHLVVEDDLEVVRERAMLRS